MRILATGVLAVWVPFVGTCDGEEPPAPWDDPARCAEVRLDAPGGPFDGYPFEGQGGTRTCYAFAASRLFDAWLARAGARPPSVRTSALYAALDTLATGHADSELGGGSVCEVLDRLLAADGGGCPVDAAARALDRDGDHDAYLRRLRALHAEATAARSRSRADEHERVVVATTSFLTRRALDPAVVADVDRVRAFLAIDDVDVALGRLLFEPVCGEPARLRAASAPGRCVSHTPTGLRSGATPAALRHAQFERVATALDEGRPTFVRYCGEVLRGPLRGVRWDVEGDDVPSPDPAACTPHTSVVIGRAWREGTCALRLFDSTEATARDGGKVWIRAVDLIENSWGVGEVVPRAEGAPATR